jgi:MYXO-CTERM domain-containing protein
VNFPETRGKSHLDPKRTQGEARNDSDDRHRGVFGASRNAERAAYLRSSHDSIFVFDINQIGAPAFYLREKRRKWRRNRGGRTMRIDTARPLKFSRQGLQLILPLVVTAWLAAPSICHATVLSYTGNVFTTFDAPYTGTDKVTASITLAAPLADNLNLASVTPLAFSVSDGVQTITDKTAIGSTRFEFSTDSSGNIIDWSIDVATGGGNLITTLDLPASLMIPPEDQGETVINSIVKTGNSFSPGTWTSSASPVPAPPIGAGLGTGLLSVGLLWLWRRRQNRDLAQ